MNQRISLKQEEIEVIDLQESKLLSRKDKLLAENNNQSKDILRKLNEAKSQKLNFEVIELAELHESKGDLSKLRAKKEEQQSKVRH